MTKARAKEVLEGMELLWLNEQRLATYDGSVESGEDCVTLSSYFTADELEAIAAWMRDPKGVCEA